MAPPDDTLAAWPDHWLTVSCACMRTVHLPIKLLIRTHGEIVRLPDLVARLRCSACGGRVTDARMVANPQAGAQGYATGFPHRATPPSQD